MQSIMAPDFIGCTVFWLENAKECLEDGRFSSSGSTNDAYFLAWLKI